MAHQHQSKTIKAYLWGRKHYKAFPLETRDTVANEALLIFPDDTEAQLAYVNGFVQAKKHHTAE